MIAMRMAAFAAFAGVATPAAAAEHHLELWLAHSVSADLDKGYFIEFDTAQRFRSEPQGDTYGFRLWVGRRVSEKSRMAVSVEHRFEGSDQETRLSQQASYPLGRLSGRTRLEQRFVAGEPRTGWRLRQRLGYTAPLGKSRLALSLTAEAFLTLRSTGTGGDDGLTGVRTFVGVESEWRSVEWTFGYLRQQSIRHGAADRVGHAPFVGIGLKL